MTITNQIFIRVLILLYFIQQQQICITNGFVLVQQHTVTTNHMIPIRTKSTSTTSISHPKQEQQRSLLSIVINNDKFNTILKSTPSDLDVISLVVGQENYGLGIVALGEGLWSLLSVPVSLNNAIKSLLPTIVAFIILIFISGPMITSSPIDIISLGNGIIIATSVSIGLIIHYSIRLLASFPETPKEIALFGLIVAIAGFFSFSQNLIVDGFITLPTLPTLPSIELPSLF